MTIIYIGNTFKYEMENILKLFYPVRRFKHIYETSLYPDDDYVVIRTENCNVFVTVKKGDFEKTLKTLNHPEDDLEMEAARLLYTLLNELTGVLPEWGVLTGIRPVKWVQRRLSYNKSEEIAYTSEIAKEKNLNLKTVYIGGGTPTALSAEELRFVTDAVNRYFLPNGIEYTIEAGRADTIDKEKLEVIKASGATRISINPQTFNNDVLKAIGRKHTAKQVEDCYALAKSMGFSSINMDFIAGLPTDTLESFKMSIDKAISLSPENITVHTLSLKRSSKLFEEYSTSDDYSEVLKMVQYSYKALTENGYEPYYLYRQKNTKGNLENVGYSKKGHFGKYNVYIMDEIQTILAAGAGAVTKIVLPDDIVRFYNYKYPYEYISGFDDILAKKREALKLFTESY